MKSKSNSGCSGLIILGIVGLIISFIINNFWIIIIAVIIIIALTIGIYFSVNNHNNNQSLSKTTKSSDHVKTLYSGTNNYSYKKQDNTDITYSKVEAAPNDYIVFDLETSGLNHKSDDILEIGAIKYNNGSESGRFQTYVKTNKTIPARITEINGISNETVKGAPPIRTALKEFVDFIGNYTLIAFNSDFDMSFIQYNCQKKLNTIVENEVIDALPLARKYLPELPNKKLVTIKNYFGLTVNSHNALDDCFVTNHLYQHCKSLEKLKHKYAIPFYSEGRELSEKEEKFVSRIAEICKDLKINSNLYMIPNTKILRISKHGELIIGLKLYSKLQYVILNIPYEQFIKKYNTDIKCTKSPKSEGDYTRLFIDDPEQLESFIDYFRNVNKY